MKAAILISALAFHAYAYADGSSTIPGNYNLVSGGSDCADSQLIQLDLKARTVLWWQMTYTAEKVCQQDHSQLNAPQECRQAIFAGNRVTLVDSMQEFVFGMIPGAKTVNTATLDFSDGGRTFVLNASGTGEYSPRSKNCVYKKVE